MLNVLTMKHDLDVKRTELAELEKRSADFEVRAEELRKKVDCLTIENMEEREAINTDVENLNNEKATHEDEVNAIRAEIERLEKELEAKEHEEPKNEEKTVEDRKENSTMEVRDSKEYINAYAEYIKSGDATQVRSMLTDNVSGTVAIPTMVSDIVKHAWDKEGIMSRVKKAYLKGNLKVGFELSADGAVIHTEGASAVNEESLVLGTVQLVPASIKKWISISDEVMDLRGEAFLNYVYEELAYRIAKKCADELIAKIEACGTQSTSTQVGVPAITVASLGVGTVATALGNLSDEASNPVVMMNKLTWSEFKTVQYANNYGVDPFEGLPVVFNDTIKAFSVATTGETYAIVGDLGHGALANFPNGETIEFKFDDKTDMTKDLVRVLGREYVGLGIIAPKAFVKIQK